MKKRILTLTLAALLALIPLTSCQAQKGQGIRADAEATLPLTGEVAYPPAAEKADENYGVTFTAKNITSTGATLSFYQENVPLTSLLSSPEWYAIEMYVSDSEFEGHWERILPRERQAIEMTSAEYYGCEAQQIAEQQTTRFSVDWREMYGELPPGGYRIVKILRKTADDGTVTDVYRYASFNITEEPFAGKGLTLADVPAEVKPEKDGTLSVDCHMIIQTVNYRYIHVKELTSDGKDAMCSYGYGYCLERYDGSSWSAVPYMPMDLLSEALTFPGIAMAGKYEETVSWINLYGDLDNGVYRFVKDLGETYYAYFEVVE